MIASVTMQISITKTGYRSVNATMLAAECDRLFKYPKNLLKRFSEINGHEHHSGAWNSLSF